MIILTKYAYAISLLYIVRSRFSMFKLAEWTMQTFALEKYTSQEFLMAFRPDLCHCYPLRFVLSNLKET